MSNYFVIALCLLLSLLRFDAVYFASSLTSTERPAIQLKTNLRIEINLYYGDEDEAAEPVDADIYLLNESLIDILKKAKFKPVFADGKKRSIKEEDYLEAAAKILLNQTDEEDEVLAFLISEAIAAQQASFAHTNQSGRGYFKTIKPGNYFLFGVKRINDQVIVWHQSVVVKSGSNSIQLDQNNAAIIFSHE